MNKVLILVPFAFDEKGLANRRAQRTRSSSVPTSSSSTAR